MRARLGGVPRQLRIALALASCVALATWGAVALLRLGHPGVLEWQEGGVAAHLARVRAGQALYAEPSVEFIAFPYPPLYLWVASLVGEGLGALRAVSIASTLAVLALLFIHVRRESRSALGGLVAAGVFAAAYRWAGAWFDVGRVDLLSLALALAALHIARASEGTRGALAAGALCGLAFLTKQTALLVCLPVALHLGRRGVPLVLAAAVVGGGGVLALHLASQGWSTWTLFELLAGHPWFEPGSLWTRDLPWLLPAALLATRTRVPLAVVLGALAAAWLGRAHQGGAENTLLPLALLAALVVGQAVGEAGGRGRAHPGVLLLGLVQLVLLAYDPRPLVPTGLDGVAGARVRARLAELEGPVFAPHSPELAGAPCAHAQAIVDLLSSTAAREEAAAFVRELEAALRSGRYAGVLLAEPWPDLPGLERYPRVVDLLGGGDALRPVTGHPHRPRWLYLPE